MILRSSASRTSPSAPPRGRARALAASGILAASLMGAPAAMAIGEVFAVNLRTTTPQLRQFIADAPSLMGTNVGNTISTYAMDFNTAGTILYAIRNTTDTTWDLGAIDTATGGFTVIAPVVGLTGAPSGLSVDPTTETVYVSTPTSLYTINVATGVLTYIGDFLTGGLMIDIAIDNSGNVFGHDIGTDALYSIDKTTGVATFIAGHGLAANFAQGMDFDPDTNTLYAAIYTGGGTGQYVRWDTTTGAITMLADTTSFNVEMEMAIRPAGVPSGACCLPDGTCALFSAPGCAGQGGLYSGDGTDCGTVVCPGPGACCLPNFGCSIVGAGQCAAAGGTFLGEGTSCLDCPPPPPGVFPEVEPNDTKFTPNGPFVMQAGNSILGRTTGSATTPGDNSADNFLVQTAAAPLGIYRHRLVITTDGAAGHTGTIRGLTQTSGVINQGSDATVQTSSTATNPPRYNQWYGFGKGEQLYYRVTGTASTTGNYTSTLETMPVTPINIGSYYNGLITIDRPTGNTSDIDFWVYDSQLNAIFDYGNDTPNTLTRHYNPGTYYIAYTNFNFANDQPAASDEGFLSGAVMDFPNSAVNSSTTLLPNLSIRMTDAFDSVSVATPKESQFDIVWLQFTVTDQAPVTGACCLDDGTCVQATANGCAGLGGVFSGDGVDCLDANCPQPGACCLPNFGCSVISLNQCNTAGGTFMGSGTTCGDCPPPPPGTFPEAEPNDSKAQATFVDGMQSGNIIVGNTTGSSTTVPGPASADYFEIRTAPAAPGFYRHRLTLFAGGSTAHTATMRGLNQIATAAGAWPCAVGTAGTTDTSVQTAFIPTGTQTKVSQWFGFGKGERVYYRVDGTAATTANYVSTLETTAETIVDVGDFAPGTISITTLNQGHTSDTDFWIYDSNFDAIPGYGNDDNSVDAGGPGTGLGGLLVRPYEPGTYYLAMSTFQMAHSEPSPCDDRFRTGTLLDFPHALLNSTTSVNTNVSFAVTDANGTVQVPAVRAGQFDVLLFRFTVGGGTPTCTADWNNDGLVNSNDISAFLSTWLADLSNGTTNADFDNNGQTNSNDISAFLAAWLAQLNGC